MAIIFALFILLSDLWLLIKAGAVIGAFSVVLLTLLSLLGGILVLRNGGMELLVRSRQRFLHGELPAEEIIAGFLLIPAAFLLMLPGFITDASGLLLIIPFTRNLVIRYIMRRGWFGFKVNHYGKQNAFSSTHHPDDDDQPPVDPSRIIIEGRSRQIK